MYIVGAAIFNVCNSNLCLYFGLQSVYVNPRTIELYEKVKWTAVSQWLRCCATNRKVAGSIPDGAVGISHLHNPSDSTIALESTQPLTKMSTRSISCG